MLPKKDYLIAFHWTWHQHDLHC